MDDDSNKLDGEFSRTACQLFREYTQRLEKLKERITQYANEFHEHRSGIVVNPRYIQRKLDYERNSFQAAKVNVYLKLIRKASQWLQHGPMDSPDAAMEFEIRLADFEAMVQSIDNCFSALHLDK